MQNFTGGKIKYFLKYKIAIYLSLALQEGRLSGVKIFQLSKHDISSLFSVFVSYFCFPGSGSSRPRLMRIHPKPDPQHW
jgi:hypothetical protein